MNFTAFLEAPAIIQLHASAALLALALGTVQMAAPKGTIPHRTFGIVFLAAMIVAALTAIFISEINPGGFSPIHIFVPTTLIAVVIGYRAARRRDSLNHKRHMIGLFFGALIIPGLFSFLPGRLMYEVAFG